MTDSENLDGCTLTENELEELFKKQVEGTFMWVNKDGQPFGVITYYLWNDGSFWFTCAEKKSSCFCNSEKWLRFFLYYLEGNRFRNWENSFISWPM